MSIQKIKEDIIDDYKEWVREAIGQDKLGIINICVDNFILKVEKLIETVKMDICDRK